MHLRDVEYFLTIVECGRMHAAAERLGLTQPALSKCVARLEKQLGNALFTRTENGVELTEGGKRFTEHASALRAIARRAEEEFRAAQMSSSKEAREAHEELARLYAQLAMGDIPAPTDQN